MLSWVMRIFLDLFKSYKSESQRKGKHTNGSRRYLRNDTLFEPEEVLFKDIFGEGIGLAVVVVGEGGIVGGDGPSCEGAKIVCEHKWRRILHLLMQVGGIGAGGRYSEKFCSHLHKPL